LISGVQPSNVGVPLRCFAIMSHDPIAALRHQPFRRYVMGRTVLSLGAIMQGVAIGWQIYERTGSAQALGYVGLVQVLPVFLLSLFAGQAVDRFNRRTLILAAVSLHTLVAISLAVMSAKAVGIGWIYAVLFLSGIARTLLYPANSALIPQIVPRPLFPNAVTWGANSFYTAAAIGPALSGFVIAFTGGATAVYVFNIFACLTCLLATSLVPRPPEPAPSKEVPGWASLAVGIRYVLRTKMILAPITLDMLAVVLGGATTLMPIYAKDILGVGPVGLGWLRAAPSIGGVLSAITIATMPPIQRAGRTILWAVAIFGLGTIVFGLSRNFPLSLVALFVLGAADMFSVVVRQTLIQLLTPDAMRGRVSAVNSVFIGASNELGGFESGITAQWFGAVASVVGGGIGTLLVVLGAAWMWPELRRFGPLHSAKPERVGNPPVAPEPDEVDRAA
jgi:MFS family permease